MPRHLHVTNSCIDLPLRNLRSPVAKLSDYAFSKDASDVRAVHSILVRLTLHDAVPASLASIVYPEQRIWCWLAKYLTLSG